MPSGLLKLTVSFAPSATRAWNAWLTAVSGRSRPPANATISGPRLPLETCAATSPSFATSKSPSARSPATTVSSRPSFGPHARELVAAEVLVREIDPLAVRRITEVVHPAVERRRQDPCLAAGRRHHGDLRRAVDAVFGDQEGDRAAVRAERRVALGPLVVREPHERRALVDVAGIDEPEVGAIGRVGLLLAVAGEDDLPAVCGPGGIGFGIGAGRELRASFQSRCRAHAGAPCGRP